MSKKTKAAPETKLPDSFEPQLALLVKEPPLGDSWLHELKYDGYRIACFIDGKRVRLLSRRGNDWTVRFPQIAAAAGRLPVRAALLDGEAAMVLPDGRTSFQALQNVLGGGRGGAVLHYFAFDLLHLDGRDTASLPLEERKRLLAKLIGRAPAGSILRYADHVTGDGRAFFAQAAAMGLEGIISKQRALPYQPGRGPGWVKTKCTRRQELVIGGFTDPEGARAGIGALLVGVHEPDGRLRFAGKVGTGFTVSGARSLRSKLEARARATSPFDPPPERTVAKDAHWVEPDLVAEVELAAWTDDGKVRHASFQGLRGDKAARDVVAEQPAETPQATRSRKTRR
jgi:bifunctional non-homologous end joining protein LigD